MLSPLDEHHLVFLSTSSPPPLHPCAGPNICIGITTQRGCHCPQSSPVTPHKGGSGSFTLPAGKGTPNILKSLSTASGHIPQETNPPIPALVQFSNQLGWKSKFSRTQQTVLRWSGIHPPSLGSLSAAGERMPACPSCSRTHHPPIYNARLLQTHHQRPEPDGTAQKHGALT